MQTFGAVLSVFFQQTNFLPVHVLHCFLQSCAAVVVRDISIRLMLKEDGNNICTCHVKGGQASIESSGTSIDVGAMVQKTLYYSLAAPGIE